MEEQVTAQMTRDLYRPERLMTEPEMMPPIALPITAGTRCAPATVADGRGVDVTWK